MLARALIARVFCKAKLKSASRKAKKE